MAIGCRELPRIRKECDPACNLCEYSASLNYVSECIERMEELDKILLNSGDDRLIRLANTIRDVMDLVKERPIV